MAISAPEEPSIPELPPGLHSPDAILQPHVSALPGIRLLPSETIRHVEPVEIQMPSKPPSSVEAIMSLTGVQRAKDIGNNGPSMASKASAENGHHPNLNKYDTLFGRDSLTIANFTYRFYPNLLKATVLRLAELQGREYNLQKEEEPGRIPHEVRRPDDPMAIRLTEDKGWGLPYYGSIDAPASFISSFVKVASNEGLDFLDTPYTDQDGQGHKAEEAFANTVGWLEAKLASNSEGVLEFKASFPGSLENQAWKDSWDSYFHADGTIANHKQGIASVEVQALTYDALLDAAELYEQKLNHVQDPTEQQGIQAKIDSLNRQASKLRATVMDKFWVEDERGGYFALGTDRDDQGNLRALAIRTSNMGHLLDSRLLESDDLETVRRREAVIKTLFSDEMLAPAGIRTLSNREVRFRPNAYHNGSVWLWDNFKIALGLIRHGYDGLGYELCQRINWVVDETHLLPEFVSGGELGEPLINNRVVEVWDDNLKRDTKVEEVPQPKQGWTAAAVRASRELYNPLDPANSLPLHATDPQKQSLEERILFRIGNLTDKSNLEA